jgi:hypothetical protein
MIFIFPKISKGNHKIDIFSFFKSPDNSEFGCKTVSPFWSATYVLLIECDMRKLDE